MSPTLATQATQTSDIACERPPRLDEFFKPLAGGPNLFDLPENEWKAWRLVFNKGFSLDNLASFVPGMVEETLQYRHTLKRYAKSGELVRLDFVTLRFTIDFIGRTVLNASLGAQTGKNVLADSMLSQASWQMPNREINPLEFLNLPRYVMHWVNSRKMDNYIGVELDKRFRAYQDNSIDAASKSVMDLVLQAYMDDPAKNKSSGIRAAVQLDPEFRAFAISQVRLFLFVGHDSMSSTICYALHLLSTNPSTLSRIRSEHDEVLGSDVLSLPSLLVEKPQLLGSLPYTNAVIKETLRLFPPGSGIRQGARGVDLVGEDGTRYPTEDTLIWILHTAMHRVPENWIDPDAFLPERWLVGPDHRLYPSKGAWRAFEWGPRNCIGQSLAMTELRLTLTMIVRDFDFTPGYEEWDRLHPHKGIRTYRGERAYQIEEAAAHPAENYPCRVSISEYSRSRVPGGV
ncbi:MAG: hypothetical protein LQ337_004571 [Flavoplaca oasis]|nr:MAG: hypothetical protein LQ337_004571 [Flavoplaca oasis]